MCSQKKNSIKKQIFQYLFFVLLFTAGLFFYRYRIKVQKDFFDYYLGVMCVDVDSGSIPETGE